MIVIAGRICVWFAVIRGFRYPLQDNSPPHTMVGIYNGAWLYNQTFLARKWL